MKANRIEVVPQSSCIGAEIRGVDLATGVDPELHASINQVLLDHQIIFFRDQNLTPAQYCDFAANFGPLEDYLFADGMDGYPYITEIVKTETETESFGSFWHSDSTYLERPPKITFLCAREVPARGGDTLFSDMYRAYADLSPGLRATLATLRAVNSAAVVPRDEDVYAEVKSKNSDKAGQQAIHPVVRVHDETGKPALYVNGIHTLRFDGMTRDESLPLLNYLYARVPRPEYTFRLRWQADTLALWDNRCTQHYALNDYHGYRRVMHRIIVEGGEPRGVE